MTRSSKPHCHVATTAKLPPPPPLCCHQGHCRHTNCCRASAVASLLPSSHRSRRHHRRHHCRRHRCLRCRRPHFLCYCRLRHQRRYAAATLLATLLRCHQCGFDGEFMALPLSSPPPHRFVTVPARRCGHPPPLGLLDAWKMWLWQQWCHQQWCCGHAWGVGVGVGVGYPLSLAW